MQAGSTISAEIRGATAAQIGGQFAAAVLAAVGCD